MLAKPSFFIRFASRASIRWLRDVDRPPRRSLSNEPLIARGTPPNLGGEFLLQAPHKWPSRRLLLPQGLQWIDAGGTPRGNQRCRQCRQEQRNRQFSEKQGNRAFQFR